MIRPKDQEYDQKYIGRHFQIHFNTETMKYYIKDLGNGFGTFIKLQSDCLLKDNSLINIGDSYIVCTFGQEEDTQNSELLSDYNMKNYNTKEKEKDNMLNIKIFSGNPKYDPMYK